MLLGHCVMKYVLMYLPSMFVVNIYNSYSSSELAYHLDSPISTAKSEGSVLLVDDVPQLGCPHELGNHSDSPISALKSEGLVPLSSVVDDVEKLRSSCDDLSARLKKVTLQAGAAAKVVDSVQSKIREKEIHTSESIEKLKKFLEIAEGITEAIGEDNE